MGRCATELSLEVFYSISTVPMKTTPLLTILETWSAQTLQSKALGVHELYGSLSDTLWSDDLAMELISVSLW